MLDAVVIGAGQAGLAVSHVLRRSGLEHVVLERDRVGSSWTTRRWDSFALNTPSWMGRLPGDTDATLLGPLDGFGTGAAFQGRLAAYAGRWDLPIRAGATVDRAEPADAGWRIRLAADSAPIDARSVIAASGIQNVPRIPPMAAQLPTDILQLSGLDYRSPGALPPGAVLVVGSGQTGGQIVEDLLEAGRVVHLSTSRVGRLPRRYRGRDSMAWLVDIGWFDRSLEDVSDPAVRAVRQPLISGVGRLGHTLGLGDLAARGVRLVGRIRAVDASRVALDDTVAECVRLGDTTSQEIRAVIDDGLRDRGIDPPPLEDDPADAAHPDPDLLHSPAILDVRREAISTVIWSTGVRGDFGYLPAAALDAAGGPIHDHGVGPLPGLFHVGYPWLSRRSSGIIHGVAVDAEAIGALVARRAGVTAR